MISVLFRVISSNCTIFKKFKDTHREKAPETPTLTKNTNIDIWAVGTSN